jgi:hypothetical protein
MKQAMMVVAGLILATSGCTVVTEVNPLYEEVNYHPETSAGSVQPVDKALAVVQFEDARPSTAESQHLLLNSLPFVWATRGVDSHPEAVHNNTIYSTSRPVYALGTLNEALTRLLARDLHRTRQFSKVDFVEALPKKTDEYDLVLRGKLLNSDLTTDRYAYCLGPLAYVPYLLGAPVVLYRPDLVVEWQLFDSKGEPLGKPQRVGAVDVKPISQYAGLYYGWYRNHRIVIMGVVSEAIKQVNAQIVPRVGLELTE